MYLFDHGCVVAGLEVGCSDQALAARMVQCVLDLVRAIRRVEAHHDHAQAGGCHLCEHPFDVVRRPDSQPVALHEPCTAQGASQEVNLFPEFVVRPADILVSNNESIAVAVGIDGGAKVGPDGLVEQWVFCRSSGSAQHDPSVAHTRTVSSNLSPHGLPPQPSRAAASSWS